MVIVFVFILLLCLLNIKIAGFGKFSDDYLSANNMDGVKGLFTLLLLLSQFASYISMKKPLDQPYAVFKNYMGQAIVGPIFFFTGYEIFQLIREKKSNVDRMPVHNIWKALFFAHAALLLHFVIQKFRGRVYTPVYYLQAVMFWKGLGNLDWFVFTVAALYLVTYISFLPFAEDHPDIGLIWNAVLTVVLTLFVMKYKSGYWYNFYFCYWIGMVYARWKKELDESLMRSGKTWFMTLLVLGFSFYVFHQNRGGTMGLLFTECFAVSFCLLVVLLMMKVSLNDPILVYSGKHFFTIIILMRLPMVLMQGILGKINDYWYFVFCFVVTFILCAVFDMFVSTLWGILTTLTEKKEA